MRLISRIGLARGCRPGLVRTHPAGLSTLAGCLRVKPASVAAKDGTRRPRRCAYHGRRRRAHRFVLRRLRACWRGRGWSGLLCRGLPPAVGINPRVVGIHISLDDLVTDGRITLTQRSSNIPAIGLIDRIILPSLIPDIPAIGLVDRIILPYLIPDIPAIGLVDRIILPHLISDIPAIRLVDRIILPHLSSNVPAIGLVD